MKCALPGRYGRKSLVESSAIQDSYYETDIDGEKILSEDIELNFNEVITNYNKAVNDMLKDYESYEDKRKWEIKTINDFEKLKKEILQKDAEKHSQK